MKIEFDMRDMDKAIKELDQIDRRMRFRITQRASREGAQVFAKALKKAYRALPIKKSGARELARTVRRKAAKRRRGKGGATNILVGNARGEGFFWNWVERGTRPHAVGLGSSQESGVQHGAMHPGTKALSPIRKTLKSSAEEVLTEIAAWLRSGIRQAR